MLRRISTSLMVVYRKVITSIAFIPGLIAFALLSLSLVMIEFDFSSTGKDLKSNLPWLSLKDAETARALCTTIAAGIFSLAVFSFSMVMIVLSQAAAQMSNRIIGKLIQNRFQQVVLGFYIGTILYALFLLSTIRDIDKGVHVPAISSYVLISLAIVDIFLFIYFLHYVTESVKFDTIIHRVFNETFKGMKSACVVHGEISRNVGLEGRGVKAFNSGAYEGFDRKLLLSFCKKHDITVSLEHPVRTFMIRDATTLLTIAGKDMVDEKLDTELSDMIDIGRTHSISTSYYYGFKQLMEIGIKALSPGINDPGTCILSLRAMGELLAWRLLHSPETIIKDEDGTVRIRTIEKTFDEILNEYVLPIWDYGKNDRLVQYELVHLLKQLQLLASSTAVNTLIEKCRTQINNFP